MAKENSFDIVSEFDQQELVNALDQARRDVSTRFDLKDCGATIDLEEGKRIVVTAPDEMKLSNIIDIIESKVISRKLSPFILDRQTIEESLGGNVRQPINLKQGLDKEVAKEIVAEIKKTKLKVQSSVQGEQVRVSGKDRDSLQEAMAAVRSYGETKNLPLQFNNYR